MDSACASKSIVKQKIFKSRETGFWFAWFVFMLIIFEWPIKWIFNSIEPFILGLPLNMFYTIFWVLTWAVSFTIFVTRLLQKVR